MEASLLQDVGELLANADGNKGNDAAAAAATPASPSETKPQKWQIPSAPQEIQAPTRLPESPEHVRNNVQIPKAFDQSEDDTVSFCNTFAT